jgi:hypothetical protein
MEDDMTMFDDRAKGFENKFAHDETLQFQSKARRNKSIAKWASHIMGLSEQASIDYIAETTKIGLSKFGDRNVLEKIKSDFEAHQIGLSDEEIEIQFDKFLAEAQQLGPPKR